MNYLKLIICASLLPLAISNLFAEILLPRFFSDRMVLQRDMPVKIWGKADADAKVEVEFAGVKKSAHADENGKWELFLEPLAASSENREMKIFENGKLSKTIKEVLVGEVWITSGQSNMEFNLRGTSEAKNAIARADYPKLRFFEQPISAVGANEKQWDVQENSAWVNSSPKVAPRLHALAFYFGEKLHLNLGVPVGIIQSARGASIMFAWTPIEYYGDSAEFNRRLRHFNSALKKYDYERELELYKEKLASWEAAVKLAKAEKKTPPRKPAEPSKLGPGGVHEMPEKLYNAKIAPFAGLSARGFLWYQGEFDAYEKPGLFADMFRALINAWRSEWKRPDMPFYYIQLPSQENTRYRQVRWEQFQIFRELGNVDMAVVVDTGEEKDNHPKDKHIVGERVANIALNKIYKILPDSQYGPIFKGVSYDGNRAVVEFDAFQNKLVQDGELRGFEVKIDGRWQTPSNVWLSKNKIEIEGKKPLEGVRYLWKGWARPDVCVRDSRGLPAMSFTDEK